MDADPRRPLAWWRDLALVGAIATFVVMTVAVGAGATDGLDRQVMAAVGGLHGDGWTIVAEVVTWLGGVGGVATIGALVVGWLLVRREPRAAAHVALTLALGALLVVVFKGAMDRSRPDVFAWLSAPHGASFPSGHSTSAALAMPMAMSVVAWRTRPRPGIAALVVALVAALVVAVGLSRMYLGVHWPSDVIAGWALGLGWWRVAMRLAPAM